MIGVPTQLSRGWIATYFHGDPTGDVPGSLVAWRRKKGRALARDPQTAYKIAHCATISLLLFFSFLSSHRKALTEPATTIV